MKIEYILFSAVVVVVIAFMMIFLIVIKDIKKKIVRKHIDNFNNTMNQKVTKKELDSIVKYAERNKKYLTPTLYKRTLNKVSQDRVRI